MKTPPGTQPDLLATRLSTLSDQTRLRLLVLLEAEELTVGEIAKVVQSPQSTVSRHLKALTDAGWLQRRSEATSTLYSLSMDDLDPSARALWVTVREQAGMREDWQEDRSRARAVLLERKTDSRSFFGRIAGEWDAVRGSLFGSVFTAQGLLHLLASDLVVADLGCGTGNVAELLCPIVKRVIAIDQSEPMLEAARKRLSSFENVEFREGSLDRLPAAEAEVDVAVLSLVLHHVEDMRCALHEAARVVRPGGRVLVVDMLAHDRREFVARMGHRHLGFDEDSVKATLEESGLVSARFCALPSDPNSLGPGLFAAIGEKPARRT